jgi:NADPH:quinone reductase
MALSERSSVCWTVERLGEPQDALVLRERAARAPAVGEVSLRVIAAGINFLDVLACRGQYPGQPGPPFAIGVELIGEVLATGPEVPVLAGSRLVGIAPLPLGALADEVTLPTWLLHPVAPGVDPVAAAALPVNYQTAHFALHRLGRLQPGETLLVHAGAGGVGTAATQLGVAAGAVVIGAVGSDEKAARCLKEGAAVAVNVRRQDLAAEVLAATDGRGADLIIDSVGGEAFDRSLDCVAFEGRIVVIGFSSGNVPAPSVGRLLRQNATLTGLSWGEHYPRRAPALVDAVYDELFAMLGPGVIVPRVEIVDFGEVPGALARLAERRTTGKLVCNVAIG